MQPCALVILGPTASGKSALALALAKEVPLEIISLDSALIYRGMDIGTAKPTPGERAAVPHHLIDICDPAESYSAAAFREDCIRLAGEIAARGKLPVICGGTMLYYKALVDGLSPLPPTDPAIRSQVCAAGESEGWPALHARLKDIDPPLYARLSPNDRQRVSRALEVYYMTGRPLSSFYQEKGRACPFPRLESVILPKADRSDLRVLIKERFLKMLEDGLIAEVEALRARGDLTLSHPSVRCVGYRQVWEYLDGTFSYSEMVERAVIATCHLAKHQMTWLRGGLSGERTVLPLERQAALEKVLSLALSLQGRFGD